MPLAVVTVVAPSGMSLDHSFLSTITAGHMSVRGPRGGDVGALAAGRSWTGVDESMSRMRCVRLLC